MVSALLRQIVSLSIVMLACVSITRADVDTDEIQHSPQALQSPRHYVGSTWAVTLFGQDSKLVGSLVIRFTDQKASSCMRGDWRRLEVLRRTFDNESTALAKKPLSYLLERGKITLGVTEDCDGYVFLRGVPTNVGLVGDYGAVSPGGFHKFGSFAAVVIDK